LCYFATDGCPKQFHTVQKKYTTNQNKKGKGSAFKDFLLDCAQKITEPAESEKEKDSADDESLASISTVPTPPPRKRPPVTDPAELCTMVSKFIKWFFFTK
jgi:hypothetical protein